MHDVVLAGYNPREQADWMPDEGAHLYVRDILDSIFGVVLEDLDTPDNRHILPLGILGALDWIRACGWWVWKETGFIHTGEQYKWVYEYDDYEFHPDKLIIIKERPEKNTFQERRDNPGMLTDREYAEAVPFVQRYYERWDSEPPPHEFTELVLWSVFLWVLSDYGKDWLYMQHEWIAIAMDHDVCYVYDDEETGDRFLLDPELMFTSERAQYTCRYCAEEQWCVQGYQVDDSKWQLVCNTCAQKLNEVHRMDPDDDRLEDPLCGSDTCKNSDCPHLSRDMWEDMYEAGKGRVQAYEDYMDRHLEGRTPYQLAGETLDDVIERSRRD